MRVFAWLRPPATPNTFRVRQFPAVLWKPPLPPAFRDEVDRGSQGGSDGARIGDGGIHGERKEIANTDKRHRGGCGEEIGRGAEAEDRDRRVANRSQSREDGNKAFERGGSGDAQSASPDQLRDSREAKEDLLAGDGVLHPLSDFGASPTRNEHHNAET